MVVIQRCLLATLACASLSIAQQCPPAIQIDTQPQVFVLTDITNEPDDSMSLVRLLLHSDQYNITGIVATTSYWLNSTVRPEAILNTTSVWDQVVDNLNLHSAGEFPTKEYLESIVKAGHPIYGTAAIGKPLSSGASHLIDVLDSLPSTNILHIQAWGGVNVLGEALAHARNARTTLDLETFVRKIRLYTISDQDNVGPWIRLNFPQIPYIVSQHGFNQYDLAAWTGMTASDNGGSDTALVSQDYATQNLQIGPLGPYYPNIKYSMEGDTPTLLHTMNNGLNGGPFDHAEWGGWGGRYILQDPSRQTNVYSDAADTVIGVDNQTHTSSQASIWRWRQAYQDEMSARVQWSIRGDYLNGSHPPVVVVNGSCGSAPISFDVDPLETITLDGSETYDPDNRTSSLEFSWFQYSEPSATLGGATVPKLNFTLTDEGRVASIKMPSAEEACRAPEAVQNEGLGIQAVCQEYHVILEVKGSGRPFPIRRYRMVLLKVRSPLIGEGRRGVRRRDEL
ncbi:hypothetical protein CLAFUW4_12348 [Fulvia fulva]|uniref:Cellulose-binding protein n=1 Tax=Passalora fulva TaxID=5499 RepID=A0A9Q8US92_PASFU|nr:uncharacterized protein CLAFUR5_11377 [Fulvia fulva]KAK4618269.1 hypothetical protein CLAFUR4_12353 [Fulvia fulva]KAK4619275.1 hypothetical protein CLAFUR0_12364 [Fulvia fulva]UJO20532.1 hypothetical protein CLAFUR5_11377 [Fulvia fulva]WPV18117.1 hypothetical protein CLAFUW4_12348 [Fulvia fulva]WPV33145.1 hypothetical protein CLAFUW7_12355 [Fulvia fulva]